MRVLECEIEKSMVYTLNMIYFSLIADEIFIVMFLSVIWHVSLTKNSLRLKTLLAQAHSCNEPNQGRA